MCLLISHLVSLPPAGVLCTTVSPSLFLSLPFFPLPILVVQQKFLTHGIKPGCWKASKRGDGYPRQGSQASRLLQVASRASTAPCPRRPPAQRPLLLLPRATREPTTAASGALAAGRRQPARATSLRARGVCQHGGYTRELSRTSQTHALSQAPLPKY